MSAIETGGPAFPSMNAHQNGPNTFHYEGISIRDYFAAKAMQGILANNGCYPTRQEHFNNIAEDSHRMADAMLAERAKGGA